MPKPKVAPRTSHDNAECPWCASRHHGRVRFGTLLAGLLGAFAPTPVAIAASNPDWPPNERVAAASLAKRDFWPSDSEYGYLPTSGNESPTGQWWLYSFVPERSTANVVLRQPNLAAGLSVDAAWRFTQGTPSVVLAFLDDGVDLSEADLLDNVFLNVGELKHVPPTHVDGTACNRLDPKQEGSPKFDCAVPNDGVATLADYREMLGWFDGNIGVDLNGNGRFDLEDLIGEFSDNSDDDDNGFVDDIAGWDFVDSDNLPSPVLTNRGTQSALDAVALANNGEGIAGVCPHCRALPIRVAHQRGASPQMTALGLLYASSMGATVSLLGHLPKGRARVLDSALAVGTARNHLVFVPRSGEQQKLPELRFDSDSVRTIGSLTLLGGNAMSTGSFVATDPCQTLEPSPGLVSAAPQCSGRAPAVATGLAGLVSSFARTQSSTAQLSAQELAAVLEHASDSVKQDDSHSTDPNVTSDDAATTTRLNANKAMLELQEGLVPPEIDIERPRWYETFAPASDSLQLGVYGRVSAPHCDSYDIRFEMAVGDPSTASDFTIVGNQPGISREKSFPSGTILGNADLHSWYAGVKEKNDKLSSSGFIATLRVRVIGKCAGTDGQGNTTVESEVRRQIVIARDPMLLSGFPYRLDASPNSPKLADLDGNGGQEIVIGTMDGQLLALGIAQGAPKDIFATTVRTRLLPAYQRLRGSDKSSAAAHHFPLLAGSPPVSADLGTEAIAGPVAIDDLDHDGSLEVIFGGETGRIYVVRSNGENQPGWPRCLEQTSTLADCAKPNSAYSTLSSAPVLADIDGDTEREIVIAANDGKVHAFEPTGLVVGEQANGKEGSIWPIELTARTGNEAIALPTSPAVGDMNGDHVDDLILTTSKSGAAAQAEASSAFVILGAAAPGTPGVAKNWPIGINSYDFEVDKLSREGPAPSVDIVPGNPRALLYGNATIPFFLPLDPGVESGDDSLPKMAEPVPSGDDSRGFSLNSPWGADSQLSDSPKIAPLYARPALADLDRDGKTDVILPATTSATIESLENTQPIEHRALLVMWNGDTGKMLPGSPLNMHDFVGAVTPAVADLNNDSYPEIIMPSGDGSILAVDACGRSPEGWPKFVGGPVSQTPAVGDLDGDGTLEVVVATNDGRVFAWHTAGKRDGYVPWGSAQRDNMNRSSSEQAATALGSTARRPLPVNAAGHCLTKTAEPIPTEPMELAVQGGCSCELGHEQSSTKLHQLTWLALLSMLLRRRNSRR